MTYQHENKQEHNQRHNEGFLYIDATHTDTFAKGKITDMDNNLICPGEIVPLLLDVDLLLGDDLLGDDDACDYAAKINHLATTCQYQTPIIHGVNVRLYFLDNDDSLHMSTVDEIYPRQFKANMPTHILAQIDTTQLDKNKVYYATLEAPAPAPDAPHVSTAYAAQKQYNDQPPSSVSFIPLYPRLILTYITDRRNPQLMSASDRRQVVKKDKAFLNKQTFEPHIKAEHSKAEHIRSEHIKHLPDAYPAHLYGTQFLCEDGQIFERPSHLFDVMRSMAKPSNMLFAEYFQQALNAYPEGATPETYLSDIFYDIKQFVKYFPEHETEAANLMAEYTIKWSQYIME
jgi:hypothetical protein